MSTEQGGENAGRGKHFSSREMVVVSEEAFSQCAVAEAIVILESRAEEIRREVQATRSRLAELEADLDGYLKALAAEQRRFAGSPQQLPALPEKQESHSTEVQTKVDSIRQTVRNSGVGGINRAASRNSLPAWESK